MGTDREKGEARREKREEWVRVVIPSEGREAAAVEGSPSPGMLDAGQHTNLEASQ
jgi:hypothetical protein